MGELTYLLGLHIKQSTDGTFISQTQVYKRTYKEVWNEKRKSFWDSNVSINFLVSEKIYRGMIGSLLYLTVNQQDIIVQHMQMC